MANGDESSGAKRRLKVRILVGVAGFLISGLVVAIWFDKHRSHRAVTRCHLFAPMLLSSRLLAPNVKTNWASRDLILASLDVLAERKSEIVRVEANELLGSAEPYLWLNAAIYLGEIGDQNAVPYLIKAFRHTAYRDLNMRRRLLNELTQVEFPTFEGWTNWWGSREVPPGFDWNSHLGFR